MKRLSRRAVLKGIGGTVIALPMLEAMLERPSRAQAVTVPKRFFVCFGGQSLGGDGDSIHNMYVPDTVGSNYDLKTALEPLAGVKNDVSVVSGLQIPYGSSAPAGGFSGDFHTNTLGPLFSGMRTSGNYTVNGPTSDQIVAAAIAGDTVFKSLVYRVQAKWYLTGSEPSRRDLMSYKMSGGQLTAIPATVSPQQAFTSLFTSFVPADPQAAAQREFMLRKRKSVLDLVLGRANRLSSKLGRADQQRVSRHFDEIRDLERRITAVGPTGGNVCQQLPDPGPDPVEGAEQAADAPMGGSGYNYNVAYSNEDLRARVMCDLVHMAFTCDLTRAGSLMFTMAQSHMNAYPLTDAHYMYDIHEVGHGGPGTLGVSKVIAWHMKHFAYLIGKLRDTPEGAGSVLDNCAMVFLHEGGHGHAGAENKENSSHSTENMACLIAGRAGGLRSGQHVVAAGQHPGNVLVTAMNAVGVQSGLGEVSGNIPALLG